MNNKEYKEYINSLSLLEVKNVYYNLVENTKRYKECIKTSSIELTNIDENDNKYLYKVSKIIDSLKFYKDSLKDCNKCLDLLNPIMIKKQVESNNNKEYNLYIDNNRSNIDILVKAVKDKEKEFIDNGCKVIIDNKEVSIDKEEIHEIHELLLKETILLIKDRVGNILNISKLEYNNNKGFDCTIVGNKGTIEINTIQAGGYNIQKLHYRTLVNVY